MVKTQSITLIPGDGVGPEVTTAACMVIDAAAQQTGLKIHWEVCEAGAEVFKKGLASGVPAETLDSIWRNRLVLKGPLTTPVGYGEKSANVTLRKLFETYGNIRPIQEFPGVASPFQGMGIDCVIVRENVEDLYAGIEYMQTPGVAQALKLISKKGCEKIVRLAFEFARSQGRKKIHCATKANILKFSEGLLKKTFEELAADYRDIETHHIIVDNCAHQLVKNPTQFDVIVTTNMNGDILSDLGSALIGGLGFAPAANIGQDVAIFEAVHGSAPKYATQNLINPTAVLLSGVMLLRYMQAFETADLIENALFVTLENGIVTQDVKKASGFVGTQDFAHAVKDNLGCVSEKWRPRPQHPLQISPLPLRAERVKTKSRECVGVDIFIESSLDAQVLGQSIEKLCAASPFVLQLIANRGVVAYPVTSSVPCDGVDLWCCRFLWRHPASCDQEKDIFALLNQVGQTYAWMHVEKLHTFDGKPGFTKAQGES